MRPLWSSAVIEPKEERSVGSDGLQGVKRVLKPAFNKVQLIKFETDLIKLLVTFFFDLNELVF